MSFSFAANANYAAVTSINNEPSPVEPVSGCWNWSWIFSLALSLFYPHFSFFAFCLWRYLQIKCIRNFEMGPESGLVFEFCIIVVCSLYFDPCSKNVATFLIWSIFFLWPYSCQSPHLPSPSRLSSLYLSNSINHSCWSGRLRIALYLSELQ